MSYAYSPKDNTILKLNDSGDILSKITSMKGSCEVLRDLLRDLHQSKQKITALEEEAVMLRRANKFLSR